MRRRNLRGLRGLRGPPLPPADGCVYMHARSCGRVASVRPRGVRENPQTPQTPQILAATVARKDSTSEGWGL